jgi:hypothetical protein
MSDNPDEAEQQEQIDEATESAPNFFGSLIANSIYLIVYAVIGVIILYDCKVAAANLIPTTLEGCKLTIAGMQSFIDDGNGNMIPEEIFEPNVGCKQYKNETVNINIIYKDDMIQSSKLEFKFKDNSSALTNSGVIKWLMELLNGPKSNTYSYYFGKVLSTVILTNFSLFDKMFKMLNNVATTPLSESIIIFILPYILPILFPIIIFVNLVLFVFSWFYYITAFWAVRNPLQENQDDANPVTVSWKDGKPDWWILLYYFIGFCLVGIPFMVGAIIGIIMPIYCIVFPLFATGHLKGAPEEEKFTFGNFMSTMFRFKAHVLMYHFAYYIIIGAYNSNSENGAAIAITAFIVILLIWFFDNMFGVFTPYKGTKDDYLSAIKISKRSVGGDQGAQAEAQGIPMAQAQSYEPKEDNIQKTNSDNVSTSPITGGGKKQINTKKTRKISNNINK